MFIKYPQAPKDCGVEGSLGRSYKCGIRFIQDRTIMRECSGATTARWIQENFLQKRLRNSKPHFYSLACAAFFLPHLLEFYDCAHKMSAWFQRKQAVVFIRCRPELFQRQNLWCLPCCCIIVGREFGLAGEGLLSSKIPSTQSLNSCQKF